MAPTKFPFIFFLNLLLIFCLNPSTGNHGNGLNQIFADDDQPPVRPLSLAAHGQGNSQSENCFQFFTCGPRFTCKFAQILHHKPIHWRKYFRLKIFQIFKFPGSTLRCQISAKSTDFVTNSARNSTGTTRNVTHDVLTTTRTAFDWRVNLCSGATGELHDASRKISCSTLRLFLLLTNHLNVTSKQQITNSFFISTDFHFRTRIGFGSFVDQRTIHSFHVNQIETFEIQLVRDILVESEVFLYESIAL